MNRLIVGIITAWILWLSLVTASGIVLGAENDAAEPSNFFGLQVLEVHAQAAGEFPEAEVLSAVETQPHTVLTPQAVRNSIQNIYLLGLFSNVAVEAYPLQDGVALTYILERHLLIRDIKIKKRANLMGQVLNFFHPLNNGELLRVCGIRPFAQFNEAEVQQGLENIRGFLRESGYIRSWVDYKLNINHRKYEVVVVYRIHLGAPMTIDAINFSGKPPLPEEYLKRCMALKEGAGFAKTVLDRDRLRLANYCRFYGYLDVVVGLPIISYNDERNSVTLQIPITATHPIRIKIRAPWHLWNWDWMFQYLDKSKLYDIFDLPNASVINNEALARGEEALSTAFRQRGYHFAKVETVEKSKSNDSYTERTYRVAPGPKVKVASLEFPGADKIDRQEIYSVVLTTPHHRFVLKTFEQDLATLKTLYESHGFTDVSLGQPSYEFTPDKKLVSISVPIDEGIRYQLGNVAVRGNSVLTESRLEKLVMVKSGDPLDAQKIDLVTKNLTTSYLSKGYKDVKISPDLIATDDPAIKDLFFTVAEGEHFVFGKVIYRGYFKTKRKVLSREIKTLEGKPYDYETMLESSRNISRLGIFSNVRLEPLDWYDEGERKNLVLSVTEKKATFLEFGLGYNTDEKVKGFINAYTTNLGGNHRTLGFSVLGSAKERKAELSFKEPFFANRSVNFLTRIYTHDIEKPDIHFKKDGAGISWEKQLREQSKISFGLRAENQKVRWWNTAKHLDPRDLATIRVVALGPSAVFDNRDDPRDPHSGWLTSLTAEYAPRQLGSQVAFPRSTGQFSLFLPLSKYSTFGISARYGLGSHLPITESFFAGGSKSIRGFSYESIHPPAAANGQPVSGNAMLIGNAELRYPLLWGLQGVTFFDAGNVWTQISLVGIRELRYSTGLGIRFQTPIGPIGLDYGYILNRKPGESSGKLELMIGHAF